MKNVLGAGLLILVLATSSEGRADDMRLEIAVLPELGKYSALLSRPAYAAIVLENAGVRRDPNSKLLIKDRARGVESRIAAVSFVGRKEARYTYDAGVVIGIVNSRVTFPVVVDASSLNSGMLAVTLKLPLASLLPHEVRDRIQFKINSMADKDMQRKVLDYLDWLAKDSSSGPESSAFFEAILADAYNRRENSGRVVREPQDSMLTRDQWILTVTFVLWLLLMSALFIAYLRRRARA